MIHVDVIFWHIVFGLMANFFLGQAVQCLIDIATSSIKLELKDEKNKEKWLELTSGNDGGWLIGFIERLLFFSAFWNTDLLIIIGAWLAFKVATKWDSWSNVIAIPKEIEGINSIDYLIARRKWSSHLLVSFQVGTLSNLFFSYLAAIVIGITYQMFTC